MNDVLKAKANEVKVVAWTFRQTLLPSPH